MNTPTSSPGSSGTRSVAPLSTSHVSRACTYIGGMRVDAGTYESTTDRIIDWAKRGESRYVCASNVHMVMETYDSKAFREVVNGADLVTSDGMPLVWVLRLRGHQAARRVTGPTLTLHLCDAAEREGVPVALFGGMPDVIVKMEAALLARCPNLKITAKISPPFGVFTAEQNKAFEAELEASGARVIFVGLGCPKQEQWMAARGRRLGAVLIGVGAAFNMHAGHVRRAPDWLQNCGLEWAFRFVLEPRRLWRRYLWHNPRFIWVVFKEETKRRLGFSRGAA